MLQSFKRWHHAPLNIYSVNLKPCQITLKRFFEKYKLLKINQCFYSVLVRVKASSVSRANLQLKVSPFNISNVNLSLFICKPRLPYVLQHFQHNFFTFNFSFLI